MSGTEKSNLQVRLRWATQVHAEAVSVIALRCIRDSIRDGDSAAQIRARINRLIDTKAAAIGIQPQEFDDKLETSGDAIAHADAELHRVLNASKGRGDYRA